jgi:formylglycine-generating enzyme required for sulfatase activity
VVVLVLLAVGGYLVVRKGSRPGPTGPEPPVQKDKQKDGVPPDKPVVAVPALAVVPFGEAMARRHQEAWADYLRIPVEVENKVGMKLVLIPPSGEKVPRAYYMGKYEVTQGQWQRVMGTNPSEFQAGGKKSDMVKGLNTASFPVESVSWYDCVAFCNRLSEVEGLKPYYELTVNERKGLSIANAEVKIVGGPGYHIPTDAAWEHACRAGAWTAYCFGDRVEDLGEYAWYQENSGGRTHPVGEKKANGFGLYDVHGNVREWNEEMLTNAETGAPERVHRGGSWLNPAGYCAVSHRYRHTPASRHAALGVRVARVPSGEAQVGR